VKTPTQRFDGMHKKISQKASAAEIGAKIGADSSE